MNLPKLPRHLLENRPHPNPLPKGEGTIFCQNGPSAAVKLEKACRPCRRKRQGAAAVEFAIVAPVFFLMIFGMIEFGRAVMVKQVLTNASREGARLAVLDGSTVSTVKTKVASYMSGAGIPGSTSADVDVPTDPTTAKYGDPITVTVHVPYNRVSWLPVPIYLGSKTLTATTVMRRETVQ
jgi:Flp pilus assembly protein TadG